MAEHRTMQRRALLDAARALLSEGGTDALTFPALAERTGLARSSVYEYFRSRAAVVEALCAVDFPVWAAEIEAAMQAADTAESAVVPLSGSPLRNATKKSLTSVSPTARASAIPRSVRCSA